MSELMMWRKRWQAKISQSFTDPHYATCPLGQGLRPENINTELVGEHISVVFTSDNHRTYAFEGQKNRDRFINLYRQFGARACGDPLKGAKVNGSD